jgi:predicted lipoprotein with Yx(FWY)xxD motif
MVFSKDGKNRDACQNINTCPGFWPAITTSAKPTGAAGIKASLLGTIKLKNGKKQVTYNGHPLYTFGGDSPGDTSYIGQPAQGGIWYAINPAGKVVK